MTRKDYELIASAMKASAPFASSGEKYDQYRLSVVSLAGTLGVTNPCFDVDRFIEACGVDPQQ